MYSVQAKCNSFCRVYRPIRLHGYTHAFSSSCKRVAIFRLMLYLHILNEDIVCISEVLCITFSLIILLNYMHLYAYTSCQDNTIWVIYISEAFKWGLWFKFLRTRISISSLLQRRIVFIYIYINLVEHSFTAFTPLLILCTCGRNTYRIYT